MTGVYKSTEGNVFFFYRDRHHENLNDEEMTVQRGFSLNVKIGGRGMVRSDCQAESQR